MFTGGVRTPHRAESIREYFARDGRLRHLRVLIAIDDAGRLTRAAQLLHVTQPALSTALSARGRVR